MRWSEPQQYFTIPSPALQPCRNQSLPHTYPRWYQGSSSESEDNTTTGRKGARRTKGSDGESSGGDDSGGSSNDEDGSDSESDEDSEAGWMSDAESVGADEVSKLYSEAGDLAFVDEIYGGGEVSLLLLSLWLTQARVFGSLSFACLHSNPVDVMFIKVEKSHLPFL